VVEAKDIIPILVIGGLILLGLSRARAPEEAVPPPPEKPPPPPLPPPPPYPPILAPPEEIEKEIEKARMEAEMYRAEAERLWAESERLRTEAERLWAEAEEKMERARREAEEIRERARRILERIQRVVEERRREAEEFMLQAPESQPPPPTVEIPETFTPRIPRPPGIRLSNSNLVVEDPQYVGKFITACVTWFCTNFPVRSVPHVEPLEPRALRYARETRSTIVIYVDGRYWGEIPV
jgi:ElaB/YqjD/DUF883 family membrane-anchored ribosome-binding protein